MTQTVNIHKLDASKLPDLEAIDPPPRQLFYSGIPMAEWLSLPKLGIVGSRKISAYGAYTTKQFAARLAEAGLVIVSGLAYGVDSAAHQAALEAGGLTLAVLPTPIERIYPTAHLGLAQRIRDRGGLLSEYGSGEPVQKFNFTNRNRLIAGLSDALLITEAAVNSGSLHTARFALMQGKTVMAVPGNINAPGSEGCNNLIKSGALPVTTIEDVLAALQFKGLQPRQRKFKGSAIEQEVFDQIRHGRADQDEIAASLAIEAATLAGVLTGLEINGYIRPLGNGRWSV